jgi:RND family efflux transporter MFP subunit
MINTSIFTQRMNSTKQMPGWPSSARQRVNRIARAVGIAALYSGLMVALLGRTSGCGKAIDSKPQVMAVHIVKVESVNAAQAASKPAYIAIVRAENETDYSFKVGGILELIGPEPGRDWDEGTLVKAGTVLAQLKQVDFSNAVAAARTRSDLAAKTLERFQKLRQSDAISPQELDVAVANERTAKVQLDQAQQNLTDSKLLAPIDGVILARPVNNGVTVGAGQRVLRFANNNVMSVELGVPDRVVNHFVPGREIEVEISALESQPAFIGRISEVGVAASQEGRLYRVVIKVPNPRGVIRSGMTANVRVGDLAQFEPGALRVPLSALVTAPSQGGGTNAANGANAGFARLAVFQYHDGSVTRRLIKTGDIVDSSIIVTDGLKAGDAVVTSGASFLYDGARVEVIPGKTIAE